MSEEINDPSRIAAVVFERDEPVDAALVAFIAAARQGGARVAGLVQEQGDDGQSELYDVRVRDLTSGAKIGVMQNLGPSATGCRVDPRGIAEAAALLAKAIEEQPDLLIVSRFGRLETEGAGMLAEIGEAVARGLPIVICVPVRYRESWDAFAGGLDTPVGAREAELMSWWARLSP